MTYGLIAAIAWGTSTIAAAHAARRIGTYNAVLTSQVLGLAVLMALWADVHPALPPVGSRTELGLAGAGVLGLLGWLFYYRALESGPVGMVSAIGATYGGITALLAVAVLGERVGGMAGAGITLAVGGVALAASSPPAADPAAADPATPSPAAAIPAAGGTVALVCGPPQRRAAHRVAPRPGIPLAVISALTYGVGAFLLGRYSVRAGWLAATLVAYGASVLTLVAALPFVTRQRLLADGATGLAWAAAAGLTEVIALLAFARGGQVGQVAVTAAVSSLYPAVALTAGILLFRERLTGRQVLGVSCIGAGVVLLSLT